MKYAYAIAHICVLMMPWLCQGMQFSKKITLVEKPTSVIALDYIHCVIAGSGCIMVNLINSQENRILDITKTYHVALNNDQTRFAISSKKKLAVYSAFTGKKLWQTKPIFPNSTLAFSPRESVLFAYSPGYLTSYNYVNKTSETHNILSLVEFSSSPISCHPTENKLLYPSTQDTLSTIDLEKKYEIKLVHAPKKSIIYGTYSPDGNCIAINNDFHSYSIYEPGIHFCYCMPARSFMAKIVAFAFHPHRPILAILFDNNSLRYINYKTKELIGIRMHSIRIRKWINEQIPNQRLSFLFDGKRLMMALKDKCIILRVPENNLLLIYYTLKRHNLFSDIIRLILDKFARSLGLYSVSLIQLSKT